MTDVMSVTATRMIAIAIVTVIVIVIAMVAVATASLINKKGEAYERSAGFHCRHEFRG